MGEEEDSKLTQTICISLVRKSISASGAGVVTVWPHRTLSNRKQIWAVKSVTGPVDLKGGALLLGSSLLRVDLEPEPGNAEARNQQEAGHKPGTVSG